MRKICLLIAMILPTIALSSEKETYVVIPMPVVCDESIKILDAIKKYDEKIVFVGLEETNKNSVHLWKNKETGSFTIVITPAKSDYSCIISTGTTSKYI